MKKLMLTSVLVLVLTVSISTQAAVTVFGTEADYDAATGPQIFLIDFDGSTGSTLVDGDSFSSDVTFGSPEASDPNKVRWSSDAITDAGSTIAGNNVGPMDGVFTEPVYAFALEFLSAGYAESVSVYDVNGVLLGTVTAPNASGFFGLLSTTPIKKFLIDNGDAPAGPDRFFVDDFRANESPIQAEKELTLIEYNSTVIGDDELVPELPEVPMLTPIQFTITITATNISPSSIDDVVVKDNFGGDLKLVSLNGTPVIKPPGKKVSATPIPGVTIEWTGKSAKAHLEWDVGDLPAGDSETLTIVVATDINPGQGAKSEPKNEYTEAGIHELNSGATAKGLIGEIEVEHTSDCIKVDVLEP